MKNTTCTCGQEVTMVNYYHYETCTVFNDAVKKNYCANSVIVKRIETGEVECIIGRSFSDSPDGPKIDSATMLKRMENFKASMKTGKGWFEAAIETGYSGFDYTISGGPNKGKDMRDFMFSVHGGVENKGE